MAKLLVDARWKELVLGEYRVYCGRPLDCHGLLGETNDPRLVDVAFIDYTLSSIIKINRLLGDETDLADRWILTHSLHYRRDKDGQYHPLSRKESTPRDKKGTPPRDKTASILHPSGPGRRRVPEALSEVAPYRFGIIGRFPILPAIVVCPACGHPNRVLPPPPADDLLVRRAAKPRPGSHSLRLLAKHVDRLANEARTTNRSLDEIFKARSAGLAEGDVRVDESPD